MSRRGQNEGSIYKRKDGRWAGTLSLGYRNGKRWRKSFYGATRADVQKKLADALAAHQKGLPVVSEKQTVSDYLDNWLETSARSRLRPRTFQRYQQHVRLHINPMIGHVRLARLTPQHVQQLLNDKIQEGLAPTTVRYMHAVLRRALNQAERWDLVARNAALLVDPPRVEKSEIDPLTPAQARSFLNAASGHRLEALYTVALALGLRLGEILGLEWNDIDFDRGTLTINKSLQRVGGKLIHVEPKSARSRRTISLPKTAVHALHAHRARQLEERLLAGKRWQENNLVFPTSLGTPMDGRNVARSFKNALKKAGLPPKRFHDLRHTCASFLVAQGVHPRVVMEILGHSQISLTMDTYSHVLPEFRAEAAAQIEGLLGD